jgi:hypothetical protein
LEKELLEKCLKVSISSFISFYRINFALSCKVSEIQILTVFSKGRLNWRGSRSQNCKL